VIQPGFLNIIREPAFRGKTVGTDDGVLFTAAVSVPARKCGAIAMYAGVSWRIN
jgi:hypothetical protein